MERAEVPAQSRPLTDLLAAWSGGDPEALDRLMPLVYAELCRLARRHLRRERAAHTLETGALVHEAYLRLIGQHSVSLQGRAHFLSLAAQMMRRVLLDHARRRKAGRRDHGLRVTLGDADAAVERSLDEVVAVDQALDRLERLDPRQARIVLLRTYAGLGVDEVAELLEISPATVKREWTVAKAWMRRELAAGPER